MSDPGVPAGPSAPLTVEEFRAEVQDKLSVVFHGAANPMMAMRQIARQQCEDFLVERYAELAAAVRPSEAWETAARLEERTRQAIRDRQQAGESIPALAEDYGVPEAFVAALCAWQFGRPSERPMPSKEAQALWVTMFGGVLFNLYSDQSPWLLFSQRRRVVLMMLTAMLNAEAEIDRDRGASPEPPAARRETR